MTEVSAGIRITRGLASKMASCPGVKTILRVMSQEDELHPQQGISLAAIRRQVPQDDTLRAAHKYLSTTGIIVRIKGKSSREPLWIIKPSLAYGIRNYLNSTGVYA